MGQGAKRHIPGSGSGLGSWFSAARTHAVQCTIMLSLLYFFIAKFGHHRSGARILTVKSFVGSDIFDTEQRF